MTNRKLETRVLPVSMQAITNDDDSGALKVSGLVNGTNSMSQPMEDFFDGTVFVETIANGVFERAIARADRIDFLFEHDYGKILATTENQSLNVSETSIGLEMSAEIINTSYGRDVYELITSGVIKGMSFGMIVLGESWSTNVDGVPLRTITEIELIEVSAVRNPAYLESGIESRSHGMELNKVRVPKTFEKRGKDMAEDEKKKKSTDEDEVDTSQTDDTAKEIDEDDKKDKRDDVDVVTDTSTDSDLVAGLEKVFEPITTALQDIAKTLQGVKDIADEENSTDENVDKDAEDRSLEKAKEVVEKRSKETWKQYADMFQ